MAWLSSGFTNTALVNNLFENGLIASNRVKTAMISVDRANYSPSEPYKDSPQFIGYNATISAPHMHAAACESLLPFLTSESKVLDIGSGSGYMTHVLATMVKPRGRVIGIDHIQGLVDLANRNMAKSVEGRELLENNIVEFIKKDGRQGYFTEAPFDAIHVGAAAAEYPQSLIDQLKAPGRLFIPIEETGSQHIYVIDKTADGQIESRKDFAVRYVPLTDAPV